MIETKLYTCSICGEEFKNKNKCAKHEREHSICPCKKQGCEIFLSKVIGYGKTLCGGINFDKAEIFVTYSPVCDHDNRYSMPIKYCPLCGSQIHTEKEK